MHAERLERHDPAALLEALREAGADISKPNSIRCPFHDDKHPSSGIYHGDDNAWRFKCLVCGVGGDVFDIRARVRGTDAVAELKAASASNAPIPFNKEVARKFPSLQALADSLGTVTARYEYANPDTREVELAVFRIDKEGGGKKFIQASPATGGWVMQTSPKPWPIYNRTRVRASNRVVVVEGEKCVHELAKYGIVATTSPAGAGKAGYADWSPLAGKEVILWPDFDEPGIAHMDDVGRILESLTPATSVSVIDPKDLSLEHKGDAVDFAAKCEHPREEIGGVLDNALSVGPDSEVLDIIDDTISGKWRNIPLPWAALGLCTNMLLPGTITILCGDPGAKKSFLMVQAFAFLHSQGVPVDLFELEDDRSFHLMRALTQWCGDTNLIDDGWVRENPDKARAYHTQHKDRLKTFGMRLHDAPNDSKTHDDMLEWIKERCAAGSQVIGIDPVTALSGGKEPWIADQKFMTEARRTLRASGARLILVSHPNKASKRGAGLEDLAGGKAYQRFSDTVLWLKSIHPSVNYAVRTQLGHAQFDTNAVVQIKKARKGKGGGWEVAMGFNVNRASFDEHGIIEKG